MIKEDRLVERSRNKFKEIDKDFIVVCPKCGSFYITIRRRKKPKYYCQTCKNEFDNSKAKIPYTTKKQRKEIGKQYSNPDE